MKMLFPKEAAKFITEKAKHVFIKDDGLEKVSKVICQAIREKKLDVESFKQNEVLPLDKGLTTEQLSNWIFLIDALNFNFWTPKGEPKFSVVYKGSKQTGYMAMVAAVNRAIDEGKPMYDPKYYSQLTLKDIQHIFRSETSSAMPLFDKRVEVLKEIGSSLAENFDGTFLNILKEADGNAKKLIEIVTESFPCFNDISQYEGETVAIYKRVQILVADIWMLFRGKDLGDFEDIDELTMFADYRVPQSLAFFGAITYSKSLMEKLQAEHLFQNGDPEEVEIRGVSMHAVELIVNRTRELLKKEDEASAAAAVNSIKVDYFLWDYRIKNAEELESVPYHKVRCCFY